MQRLTKQRDQEDRDAVSTQKTCDNKVTCIGQLDTNQEHIQHVKPDKKNNKINTVAMETDQSLSIYS